MSARLTSEFRVKALIRRVHDAGGSAMVMARGDSTAGGVLVIVETRDAPPVFYERGVGPDGASALIRTGPKDDGDSAATDYWRRRRARDPDLWVIELAIPEAERFAAETILDD